MTGAELHAATATLGNLFATAHIGIADARWALLGMIAARAVAKTIVAFTAGGKRFGLRVGVGLLLTIAAVALALATTAGSGDGA